MTSIRLLLALTPALLASSACELINGPSELERQIAAEQQVIAAYSADVPRVMAVRATAGDAALPGTVASSSASQRNSFL